MKRLLLMLQFTTILPIPIQLQVEDSDFQKGMKLFPIVGAVIGLILWASYRMLSAFDTLVAAVAAVLLETVITGGLHQDGLGDTFDGLFSNKNGDEMIAVMKDSRLGTHGVLAITGVLLLKVSLIRAINNPVAVLAMPVLSRLSMVLGASFSKNAREDGLGSLFIKGVGWKDALFSGALTGMILYYLTGALCTVISIAAATAAVLGYIRLFDRKIGGMTGDTLGAVGEICSVLFLTVFAVLSTVISGQ
ncbi:MAG: Cobalamin synthase [Firmicutes bacterium]|nr:Cobalamin synthase [Bacillota bacterium]MDI6704943.1 adenosylcobinamide-GDP ribazoletransferase [Bacillota bacterium]